jgi:hypothetical protein
LTRRGKWRDLGNCVVSCVDALIEKHVVCICSKCRILAVGAECIFEKVEKCEKMTLGDSDVK